MSYLIKTPLDLARMRDGTYGKYFKGGGGGGEREATAEEKRLWGAQADSLEKMNAVAMPNLVTGMGNLGTLANEAMDGTLGNKLRTQALSDVNVSLGTSANDALRAYGSTGGNFDPTSTGGAAIAAKWGLDAAKMRSGAAGQANMAAEDQRWQRNAALTGLASGQGNSAVQGMGQLAGQLSQNRANANNMDLQNQNNTAQAIGGLAIGGKMAGLYKDGGEVKAADGLRMFSPAKMPTVAPFTFNADDEAPKPDGGIMPTVVNTGTSAIGTRMMANGLDKVGISAPKQAIDGLTTAAKDFITSPGMDATKAALGEASANYGAQATAAGEAGELALAEKAMEAKGMVDAGGATALAAEGAASGSSLMGAVGAAAPWLIGGYAIGSMLDLWADGGEIRKDMTAGGAVKGPGTETSDSVKALLSDGEIVVNAKAVDLPAGETKKVVAKWDGKNTSDLLMSINDRGLEKRYGKEGAKASPRYEGGAQKLALGGLAQALGRGLYTAAPMLNQIDQQREDKAYKQAQLGFQQSAENRTQSEFDRQNTERAALQEIGKKYAEGVRGIGMDSQAMQAGKMSKVDFAKKYAPLYTEYVKDGKSLQPLANGNFALTENGASANYKEVTPDEVAGYLNAPEMQMRVYEQMFSEMATVNPAYAQQAYGVFKDKLGEARAQRGEKRADRHMQLAENQDQRAGEAFNYEWKDWNGTPGGYRGRQMAIAGAAAGHAAAADKRAAETHGVNLEAATLALGQSKTVQEARELQAEGKPLLPKHKAALAGVKGADYKVEMGEVASALGTPATDKDGKPVADLMTGRQVVNRNVDEEQKFFKWMRDNNITDTNRGLAIYLGNKSGAGAQPGPGKNPQITITKIPAEAPVKPISR
jgi:hypothetical protein